MSLLRSPTGSDLVTAMSGSQPNLTNERINPNITLRSKRKFVNDNDWIKTDMAELKKQLSDVMNVLVLSRNEQIENINKICQDMSDIKDQLTNMKSTLDTVVTEQKNLKSRLNTVETTALCMEGKITKIEDNIAKLKIETADQQKTTEEIITEIHERAIRRKNIIIEGIPEVQSKFVSDRLKHDKDKCLSVLKHFISDCPNPEKLFRIGKYNPNQNRPIKLSLSTEELVKTVLTNRNKHGIDNIKIYSDQTKLQRENIKKLKDEIKRRVKEGETDLRIKYIRGAPRIISRGITDNPKS